MKNLPYKNMNSPLVIKEVVRIPSKKLKVGDVFTYFDPTKILPSYYEVIREEDLYCHVYKLVTQE